ncbi:DoxX family protein [Adhaeribacter arboris]|uniref:DoxX family protein n=1 Tax=Adhaeribacter arboris TaxID=2072846 RepID=UPI001E5830C8|nr:DoxX family protein [Adhaeribacter arboris]
MATAEISLPVSKKKAFEKVNVPEPPVPSSDWNKLEKAAFRFFFIYFFIQAVPLDWKYFRNLFSINWLDLHFRDIFYLSRYTPQFFSTPENTSGWGIGSFADWGIVLAIAVVGAVVWSLVGRNRKEYNQLYYWVRVILRYRLAIGLIAYAFIKIYPMQAPIPSISNLNTHYGDFNAWKIFSLTLGIVPDYQSFLGLVELLAAGLLFFRKTASIGAFLVLPFTGNVFMSNLAYEGGEYVYSFYLITIALYLFAYDGKRLFTLLTLEQPTLPNRFHPKFTDWQKSARLVLKSSFVFVFVLLYGYKTYAVYQKEGSYHFPKTAGLPNTSGLYNVKEFRVNNQVLPYSATDPIRWQDVVFEKWATISIRSNQQAPLEYAKTEEIFLNDQERNYEEAGSGGRQYYSYQFDAANQTLILQNKNKNRQNEKLTLKYERPNANQIILSGLNEKNELVYVVLEKINKKYLLDEVAREGRQKPMKL